MNLLLIPGKNPHNREWLIEVETALASRFERTQRYDLALWTSDNQETNVTAEVTKLKQEVVDLEPYCVFAKSAGSIITIAAAAQSVLQPKAALIVGFPLPMVSRLNLPFEQWLHTTDFPIIIAQNDQDTAGSYEEIKAYFESTGRANITYHKLIGNTHKYTDYASLKQLAALL